MYFLDVDATESLDSKDVSDLSTHHKLRPAIISVGFLPIQTIQPERASQAKAQPSRVLLLTNSPVMVALAFESDFRPGSSAARVRGISVIVSSPRPVCRVSIVTCVRYMRGLPSRSS